MDKLTLAEVPELPGYISVAVASERFGVHKGTIYYMIYTQRKFRHVYKINTSAVTAASDDPRPVLLLLEAEAEAVFEERKRADAAMPAVQVLRLWNRRVKQWGIDTGWDASPIHPSGRPPTELVYAYEQANPNDPRPE